MLDDVVKLCNKHSLNYFLAAGTCLGAVRHSGFIPWDDDIDIIMPREDYEKFIEISKDELGEKYFLDYYKTNRENHFGFLKVRMNNTTFQTGYEYSCHNGIFLDIFPMDYIDDKNSKKTKIIAGLSRSLLETLKLKNHNLNFKSLRRWYISILFVPFSNERIHKIIDYLYKKENNKTRKYGIVYCNIYNYKKDIYLIDNVFPYSEVTFEKDKYHAFCNTDAYLKGLYGDYMKLPPEEKRIAHKPERLDFNHGDVRNTKEEYNKLNKK